MASIFGHGMVGYTLSQGSLQNKYIVILAIASSLIPDIDVVAFEFGIAYESPWGHRGFTHSILFAFVWSIVLMWLKGGKNKLIFFSIIFLSTISHGILDACTTGGRGVGFLIPFNEQRYFFNNQFITVSPLGLDGFFSRWGLEVLKDELRYIFLPCLIIIGLKYFAPFVGKKS